MAFPYPIPLIKTVLVLESIGEVEVSTVELRSIRSCDNRTAYETCLFWDAPNDGDPHNEDVSRCFERDVALKIHAEWCDAAKIAKRIHEAQMRHIQHMGRN